MKKNFSLKKENTPTQRHIDSIKRELKKYITRERKKKVPDEYDFWKFYCKYGDSEESAVFAYANELKDKLDESVAANKESCYIEIVSKAVKDKNKK